MDIIGKRRGYLYKLQAIDHKPITNLEDAKAWLRNLIDCSADFHLEDDPADYSTLGEIFSDHAVLDVFSPRMAEIVRQRVDEVYQLNWTDTPFECGIGYMLAYQREIGMLPYWHNGEWVEYENGQQARVSYVSPLDHSYAVLRKATAEGVEFFEAAHTNMELFAESAGWVNPLHGEPAFANIGDAIAALAVHIRRRRNPQHP